MFTKNQNKLISISFSFVLLMSTTGFSLGNKFDSLYCKTVVSDYSYKSLPSIVTADYDMPLERDTIVFTPKMTWPVLDPKISSGYGSRESCQKCSTFHEGLDFTPGIGEPVVASIDGVVVEIKDGGEYGVHIVMEHFLWMGEGETWHTVYAHLERGSVPENIFVGSEIAMGTQIGRVGRTGLITGPHLHFELRINGAKINPLPVLKKYIQEQN